MARIDAFLKLGVAQGCSDLHLAVGVPPMLRMHGDLMPIKFRDLGDAELEGYITEVLTQSQIKMLREGNDLDFSYVSSRRRPLSRQRVSQGNRHRRRVSLDSHHDAQHGSAGSAADRAQALRLPPRHDSGDRLDRHRQDHHAGVDDRLSEFDPRRSTSSAWKIRSNSFIAASRARSSSANWARICPRSPRACAPPCAKIRT